MQDGTNWYVYVNNNPLSFVDPTGLLPLFNPIRFAQFTKFTAEAFKQTANGIKEKIDNNLVIQKTRVIVKEGVKDTTDGLKKVAGMIMPPEANIAMGAMNTMEQSVKNSGQKNKYDMILDSKNIEELSNVEKVLNMNTNELQQAALEGMEKDKKIDQLETENTALKEKLSKNEAQNINTDNTSNQKQEIKIENKQ